MPRQARTPEPDTPDPEDAEEERARRPATAPANTWRNGRVVRTLWPGDAGSLRWLRRYGDQLVCVRHREDPAGLRRMVTVELLAGPVQARAGQRRLQDQAWYPLALDPAAARDAALLRRLRHLGGRPGRDGYWYLRGRLIREWNLEDRIAMRPARSAPPARAAAQAQRGTRQRHDAAPPLEPRGRKR